MLVPRADSSIDNDRLASAHLTDPVRCAPSVMVVVEFMGSPLVATPDWSYRKSTPAPNMAEDAPLHLIHAFNAL
jgi:hypothetical protein